MATLEQIADALRKADAAGNVEDARALANAYREMRDQQQGGNPQANAALDVAAQAGAGTQTGIAKGLGYPVDAMTSAINGLGSLTGLWGAIESPMGGSESISAMLAPFREGIGDPTSRAGRVARRIGEEVGAAASMAPIGFFSSAARAAPGAYAVGDLASALGGGAGASAANEVFPDSPVADVVGALAGGLPAGIAASRLAGGGGQAAKVRNGIEDQRLRARDAYNTVRADRTTLPQADVDDLALGIRQRAVEGGLDADVTSISDSLHPKALRATDAVLSRLSRPQTIGDIDDTRRFVQRNVSSSLNPDEQRLGQVMVGTIDDYLGNLDSPVVDALLEGRNAHRRMRAAEAVEEATSKAIRRAGSSGTGGNQINAIRQNLRGILDNPRRRSSFTADELKQMEDIVMGTGSQNTLRFLSRMSPSSGGLASMLHLMGSYHLPSAISVPIAAATSGAKALAERSTHSAVDALSQSLAPSRLVAPSQGGVSPVVAALLGLRQTGAD